MQRRFPAVVTWLGIPATICVWLLAARLVWEQTVWTWERGAQMVGFSLIHSGVGALLVLAVVTSLAWPVAVLAAAVWTRSRGDRRLWALLAAYATAWVLLLAPYGFWQRLFIAKFSAEQSAALMTYAAAQGDTRTVSAFLRAGVPVNAQGRHGTALHAAAIEGQLETMKFLLERGADVNAIDAYGDSPLQNARRAQKRSDEAQALLARHGARLVQGTEEQRKRAIERELREDAEGAKRSRDVR